MPKKRGGFTKSVKPTNNNLPAKTNTNGMGGSILGNLALGATIGAGSSIGHRAIDSVMGSGNQNNNPNQENSNVSCEKIIDMYHLCLKNDNNQCDYLNELLKKKCNL